MIRRREPDRIEPLRALAVQPGDRIIVEAATPGYGARLSADLKAVWPDVDWLVLDGAHVVGASVRVDPVESVTVDDDMVGVRYRLLGGGYPVVVYEAVDETDIYRPPHDPLHLYVGDAYAVSGAQYLQGLDTNPALREIDRYEADDLRNFGPANPAPDA